MLLPRSGASLAGRSGVRKPVLDRDDEGRDPDLPDGVTLFSGETVDVALDVEDRVNPAHRRNRQRRLADIGKHEQFSSPAQYPQHPSQRCSTGVGPDPNLVPSGSPISIEVSGVDVDLAGRYRRGRLGDICRAGTARPPSAPAPPAAHLSPPVLQQAPADVVPTRHLGKTGPYLLKLGDNRQLPFKPPPAPPLDSGDDFHRRTHPCSLQRSYKRR